MINSKIKLLYDSPTSLKCIPDNSVDLILSNLQESSLIHSSSGELDKLWSEYKRVLSSSGVVIAITTQPFTTKLINSDPSMFKYEIIWDKVETPALPYSPYEPVKQHMTACVFYRHSPCYNPQYRIDITDGVNLNPMYRRKHETAMPVSVVRFNNPIKLYEYLIRTYSDPDSVVLDNAMGVGNVGIAAVCNDRRFIGFESNFDNYQIANERIGRAMFGDVDDNH